jgi:hypothetical protein
MRSFFAVLTLAALVSAAVIAAAQSGAQPIVKFNKSAVAPEITTDQRDVVTPEAGQQFLWVSTTLSGAPQTVDLTKLALVNGTASYPLVGVDSVWDGDPKQFSMIASIKLKTGKTRDPLELSRSVGPISFAFTPGKVATLKVSQPPQSFCLAFLVPQAVRGGQVKGLTGVPLTIPTIAAGKL